MIRTHTLGYPRLGAGRELKRALEGYWSGDMDIDSLQAAGQELRRIHWTQQNDAGLDYVAVGDFSWYDHVLDTVVMVGAVPPRFGAAAEGAGLDGYFRMARGRSRAGTGDDTAPCEMTKWFDTNYHYIVPELTRGQAFALQEAPVFRHAEEATALGLRPKPVLVGPLTFLWLARCDGEEFDRLALLERLLPVYRAALERLDRHAGWVQIDEPVLALDLPQAWREAFAPAYETLAGVGPKLLLANYFGGLGDNLETAVALPVAGLHVDLVRAPQELDALVARWPAQKVFSAGIVDGRNVWRTDLDNALARLAPALERWGDRLWLAPSCSLLHSPLDLELEKDLDAELKSWLAFARQKLDELSILATALEEGTVSVEAELESSRRAIVTRAASARVVDPAVRRRLAAVTPDMGRRSKPYVERARMQRERLKLPALPTTTIGSFPQTPDIRAVRRDYRAGHITRRDYEARMRAEIERTIRRQEALGLDVLVHGEPERNDMVEYFGERLKGFAFTCHGWVQSYGSRAVKPPILYGDVSRPEPMTVDWFRYAQSLTERPVKGMLTGPVTVLKWSFVRDDQPSADTARQLALALRDEVSDLEGARARVIQVDEPALREGLPLKRSQWEMYLRWAVEAFRLATGGADAATQIHTHMCYADFNDIIESIAALDADVISIESSRSDMALLRAFEHFEYPNEIGPGVYDIHSPRVPDASSMAQRLHSALGSVPAQHLWVNPDCGLKTRAWPEVEAALAHMVEAAQQVRAGLR